MSHLGEFERDVAKVTSGALVEYRLAQVERRVEEVDHRMDRLATKEDLAQINRKLDQAAKLKEEHTFSWRSTIIGGAIAGAIVVVFTMLASSVFNTLASVSRTH